MRVYIGKYRNYIGPYQIAEKILFWKNKYDDESVHKLGKFLDVSWLRKLCSWIASKRKRNIEVHIDNYDIWSMDATLAYIVVPMLKQLKEDKHGSPWVDDEDVPEEIRSINAPPVKHEYEWDDNVHKRWDYVLDEMIFAFESKLVDWEDQFYTEPSNNEYFGKWNFEERNKYQQRITNGFRLFGKYYEGLWT